MEKIQIELTENELWAAIVAIDNYFDGPSNGMMNEQEVVMQQLSEKLNNIYDELSVTPEEE